MDRQAEAKAAGGDLVCVEGQDYSILATSPTADPGHIHCFCDGLGASALTHEACREWSFDQSMAMAMSYAASGTVRSSAFALPAACGCP